MQTGYIVSNADDLLGLFDADFGILVVGEGAKILGPSLHSQEILLITDYLRRQQFPYATALLVKLVRTNLNTGGFKPRKPSQKSGLI